MALPDLDTSVAHSFGIEIDGVLIKQCQEIAGLKFEQDVIELKQNTADGKYIVKKLPGRQKPGTFSITRGLTEDNSLDKWAKNSRLGKMGDARKNGAVLFFDFEGTVIKRIKITNCWLQALELGTMKAGDTSVLTEKATVTYESIEVE